MTSDPAIKISALRQRGKCISCGNCARSCPTGKIFMMRDGAGFRFPAIDSEAKCKNCGRCLKTCPIETPPPAAEWPEVFAGWHSDPEVVRGSSSGGVMSALAEAVLRKGGIVFGVELHENLPRYRAVTAVEELHTLRGSKYVATDVYDIIPEVKTALAENRQVLLIGHPCQTAAARNILRNVPGAGNLVLADFFCHGGAAPELLRKEAEKGGFTAVTFRDKTGGSWKSSALGCLDSSGKPLRIPPKKSAAFAGFNRHVTLRQSCYRCPFAALPRTADVTCGDFWGIQRFPEQQQAGISAVLANTAAGKQLLRDASSSLVLHPADIAEIAPANPRLYCGYLPYADNAVRKRMAFIIEHLPWIFVKLLLGGDYSWPVLGRLPGKLLYGSGERRRAKRVQEEALQALLSEAGSRRKGTL